MQPLKLLVIIMGLLIALGVATVVFTIVSRMGRQGTAGFGAASVMLPQGCHVIGMSTAGNKLALRLGDGPDCQIILVVDPETGRQTGRIGLVTQP